MDTIMTTSEMCDLSVHNYRALESGTPRTQAMRQLTNLRNACDIFAQRSFEDIRTVHKTAKTRGVSAEAIGFKIMTYAMCGRICITIRQIGNEENYISLQGGEDSVDSIAGLHGIYCEPDKALDWLEVITDKWYKFYDKRGANNVNLFKDDEKLSIVA